MPYTIQLLLPSHSHYRMEEVKKNSNKNSKRFFGTRTQWEGVWKLYENRYSEAKTEASLLFLKNMI